MSTNDYTSTYELQRRRWLELGLAALFVAACGIAVLLAGCASRYGHVTGLPPGVTEQQVKNWDAAVANLHKIALGTSFVRQGIMDVNQAAPLEKTYYVTFLGYIARVDELQLSATEVLRERPEYFGASEKLTVGKYATDILGQLKQLNTLGVTKISNPASAKKINALVTDLISAANLVLALTQ